MARVIFFLIDGIADLGERTPLELAKKDNIKKLLNNSFLAEFYPLKKESWPKQGSSSVSGLANLGILGYELKEGKVKRGPLEAIGSNISFKNGELALRVDFASVDKNLKVIDRRAGRNTFGFNEFEKLINSLISPYPFHFHRTYGHRAVLIFKAKLSPYISDSDPYKNFKKVRKIVPLKNDNLSKKTAKFLQEFLIRAHLALDSHPLNKIREENRILKANYLLTREAGNFLPKIKKIFQKTKFKNGLVIAENGVIKGTCILVGFSSLTLPEIENINKRYQFIRQGIINNFSKYDLIYVHLKEADEAAHDKNFKKKKDFFEFFDQWLSSIYKKFPNIIYVITGDHITDTKTGKHKYGPVPILIINSKTKNNPKNFSEKEAKNLKTKIFPKELWNAIIQ